MYHIVPEFDWVISQSMCSQVKNKLHVLFLLAGTRKRASTRYRVLQFIPELEKFGIIPNLHFPADKKIGILRPFVTWLEEQDILAKADKAEIVFIQKRLFRPSFLKELKQHCPLIVFDFDDAIFMSHGMNWSKSTACRTKQRFRAVCDTAKLILAGNRYLAKHAGTGKATIKVLPTMVDTRRYAAAICSIKQPDIRLGWIGQPVNHPYLQALSPVLQELSRRHSNLCLHVISSGHFQMEGVRIEMREWSEDSELSDLSEIDIGLMPVPDDDYARGKCALKAIQYMAMGIPPVCSNIGTNKEVIRNGLDGFLVTSESDWIESIERLIVNTETRQRMGVSAKEHATQHFDVINAAHNILNWLTELRNNGNAGH